ncbi:hypothetical protein C8P63_10857 [Melghirimyces profundicolus]|uniref:LPXTG-motif cell wall-anchored protein n=1 Tax=Melghirimyces profundicolus TaxID=1242148 RepID=A0A2T6BXP7_9BACL|nr:hypothetical protein [Melghirimyces profundicolus]PTX60747.1 hypothetical protein C8P63_10857 [Melghirimyces profundicolus]
MPSKKAKFAAITSMSLMGLLVASPVYANPSDSLQDPELSVEVDPGSGDGTPVSVQSPLDPILNPSPNQPGNPSKNPEEPEPGEPAPELPGKGDDGDELPGGDDNIGLPGGDLSGEGDDNNGRDDKNGGDHSGNNDGSDDNGTDGSAPEEDEDLVTPPDPTDPPEDKKPESVSYLHHAKEQQKMTDKSSGEEGGKIPDTSTSHPAQMLAGLMAALTGAALLCFRRFRSQQS